MYKTRKCASEISAIQSFFFFGLLLWISTIYIYLSHLGLIFVWQLFNWNFHCTISLYFYALCSNLLRECRRNQLFLHTMCEYKKKKTFFSRWIESMLACLFSFRFEHTRQTIHDQQKKIFDSNIAKSKLLDVYLMYARAHTREKKLYVLCWC